MIEIPNYTIERELGSGGMSTVYLATHDILQRQVALKVMSPHLFQDGTFKECFINEGQIISQLNSPHIIHIYDIGISNEACYMAIELLESDTLREKIDNMSLSIQAIQTTISQISSALHSAHLQSFIHRDIKPGNILYRKNNDAVLTDFGISKLQNTDGEMTTLGFTAGTPSYMPPEFSMGEELDHRTDIYSLGVVFYEMLTGEKPFKGKTAAAMSYAHVNSPIPLLEPKFSHFQVVINKVLAKKPQDRFNSVLDFSKSVEQACSSSDPTIISKRVTPENPAPSPKPVIVPIQTASVSNEDPTDINFIKPKKPWGIYLGVIFLFSLIPAGMFFVMPEKGMDIVRKLGLISDTPEKVINKPSDMPTEPIDKPKGQPIIIDIPTGNDRQIVVDPTTREEQATDLGVGVIPENIPVLENGNKFTQQLTQQLTQQQELAVYSLLGSIQLRTSFAVSEIHQYFNNEKLIEKLKGNVPDQKITDIRREIETSEEAMNFHVNLYYEHLLELKEYNVDQVLELFEAYKPIAMPLAQQKKHEIYYVLKQHISESANGDITLLKLKEDLEENTRLSIEARSKELSEQSKR